MTVQRVTDKSTAGDESLTRHPFRRVASRVAVSALVASGLALGPGIPPAGADDLATPHIQSLRLDGTKGYLTFVEPGSGEAGFFITVRERDNPDRVVFDGNLANVESPHAGDLPPANRAVTRELNGMPPGVAVCATLTAYSDPSIGVSSGMSASSNTVCSDPANATSDLALQNVRGREELQFAVNPGAAYLVEFRNAGGADATGIVVDIATSGVATLADQGGVAPGWNASGFGCVTRPPAGGETAALHCTGGHLKQGEQTNPAVMVQFTGPGFGAIHASIGGAGDTNAGNNGTALNVRVL
jgi:hypothetical protein